MITQEYNSNLLNMPVLVLEKILSNIRNPSNVSRTCKHLHEIVCGMDKRRRVMYICASDAESPLNIDDDSVFDSIINSHRKVKEMELRVGRLADKVVSLYELNERQLERILAIMTQFGANVTSLKLHGFVVPINFVLELLQQATRLESLSFTYGKVIGWVTEKATMSLKLPSLDALEMIQFPGLLDIVNLIPAGSLTSYSSCIDTSTKSTEIVKTILTKQHNVKSLCLEVRSNADLAALCIDHLQLETFIVESYGFDNVSQLVGILECQTDLRELRLINYYYVGLCRSVFRWICNNLKKLEIFDVRRLNSLREGNVFEMLGELKELRHFRTSYGNLLFNNGFQSSQLKSDSMEKFEIEAEPEFCCDALLIKMVNSMAHNLPNLTHLQMKFERFSALSFVLNNCTQIIHLTSSIRNPVPDELTQQRFPSIQSLELLDNNKYGDEKMSLSMTSIVRAMPNLKSVTMRSKLKFDVRTLKVFVKETKSLEYFYVDEFVLTGELFAYDVVKTMRCLMHQLKGYCIMFSPSTSRADDYSYIYNLNWHKTKAILTNEFYVLGDCSKQSHFCLKKDGEKEFRNEL